MRPPAIAANKRGRCFGHAAGNSEDGAVDQCVHADRRDNGVEAEEADQNPVRQAGYDRAGDRHQHRREEQSVVSLRIVCRNDDGERYASRQRKVETSLLDDQHLPQADDRNDGRKRQASLQGAVRQAGRRKQETEADQRDRRNHDRHKLSATTGTEALSPPNVRCSSDRLALHSIILRFAPWHCDTACARSGCSARASAGAESSRNLQRHLDGFASASCPVQAPSTRRRAGSCGSGSATDRFRSVRGIGSRPARRQANRCSRARSDSSSGSCRVRPGSCGRC